VKFRTMGGTRGQKRLSHRSRLSRSTEVDRIPAGGFTGGEARVRCLLYSGISYTSNRIRRAVRRVEEEKEPAFARRRRKPVVTVNYWLENFRYGLLM